MRSIFRVGGAIVVGAGLIGIAFFVQHRSNASTPAETAALIAARSDVRTVQSPTDSDNDGLPDWEEALRGTDPNVYTKITEPEAATSSEPYTPPTTITDRFAQQFLEKIIRTSAGGTMTEDEKAQLVNDSVGMLAGEIHDTLYTQGDIQSVGDNDLAAIREYGNAVGDIFLATNNNANKMLILNRAVQNQNPEVLKQLKPIEMVYAGRIKNLLAVETPTSIAPQHVALINALSLIRSDIAAMQQVFTDPLGSLVRIKRYEEDAKSLYYAFENIRSALEKNGVTYTSGESGIFLFSLRP